MGMGFAPFVSSGEPPPPASQNHFNHCCPQMSLCNFCY